MRKTIFTLGLMLAAALSLTNCTKNEEATFTPEVKVPFELYANMDDTRTTNNGLKTEWAANDAINVFHAEATTTGYVNDGSFSTEDASGLFKGTLAGELTAAAYDWYACYPYKSFMTSPNNTSESWLYVGSRSDAAQTQDGNNSMAHIAGEDYPLYGVAKNVAASAKPSITMSHASSLIEFNVTNKLSEEITVNSIVFTVVGGESEQIVGQFYMAIHEGTPSFTNGDYTSNVATLNVTNGEAIAAGESAKFYMGIKPFVADDYELTVAITATSASGTGVCTKEMTASPTFYPGKIKTLNVGFDAVIEEAAPEVWSLVTSPTQITDGTYVFVAKQKNGTTISYLPNTEASAKNVLQVNTTLFDLTTSVLESIVVPEDARWILTTTDGKYSITNPNGDYLYATDTNNGMVVGDTKDTWSITTHSNNTSAFSLKDSTSGRYLTLYSTTNWRCYTSEYSYSSSADQNGEIYIYYCGQLAATPTITANDISDVSADGVTNASASFTAQNLTEDITVTYDGDVVTTATVTDSTITYSVSKNETGAARDGWIKLAANGITVEIKVAQLAPTVSITIAQFLEKSTSDTAWYQLTGTISNIKDSTYGNLTIKDDTGEVYVYGLTKTKVSKNDQSFSSLELKAGDIVTLIGTRDEYYSSAQVGGPAYYVSHQTSCVAPEISCADNLVTITTTEANATIYYTIDGTEPTVSSQVYSEPFAITETRTVKAFAVADGKVKSVTVEKSCVYVDPNAEEPAVDYTTLNTSNVTLSTDGGTKAYEHKVKIGGYQYGAIKLGTADVAGVWKVTVPAGTTKLHLHMAGWNKENVTVSVSGATVDQSSLDLVTDTGITGNSPYTLSTSDSSTYYKVLTLSNVTTETTLTFTVTEGYRFVVWGVNAE